MSLLKPNPVEPPWYVTRMPGGVGGVASRGVPLSRSLAHLVNTTIDGEGRYRRVTGLPREISANQLAAAGHQMTLSRSSATISAADNPSQSP